MHLTWQADSSRNVMRTLKLLQVILRSDRRVASKAVYINWSATTTMNSLRPIARAALRARPAAFRAPLQRRGYAEAVNDKASCRRTRLPTSPAIASFVLTSRHLTDQAQLGPAPRGTIITSCTRLACLIRRKTREKTLNAAKMT